MLQAMLPWSRPSTLSMHCSGAGPGDLRQRHPGGRQQDSRKEPLLQFKLPEFELSFSSRPDAVQLVALVSPT
jgi:hypothetical protein